MLIVVATLSVSYFVTGNHFRGALSTAATVSLAAMAAVQRTQQPSSDAGWSGVAVVGVLAVVSRAIESGIWWWPSFAVLLVTLLVAHVSTTKRVGRSIHSITDRVSSWGRIGLGATRRRVRMPDAATWVALAITAAFVVGHAVWLAHQRSGFGLESDEARILQLAYLIPPAWEVDGLVGVARAWTSSPVVPPVLPALATPITLVTDSAAALSGVTVCFLVLLLLSAYVLARRLGGRVAGVSAVLLTGALPGVIWYSRVFEQIVPGAALWLATLTCLVCSDGLRSRPWRLAGGVVLGVGLLTRAMLIGFLPGLIAAGALHYAALDRDRRPKVSHVIQFGAVAALVAATWWGFNWDTVIDYLSTSAYDPAESWDGSGFSLAPDRWAGEGGVTLLLLGGPTKVWAVAALCALGLLGAAHRAIRDRLCEARGAARRLLATDEVFLAVVAATGYVTLVSNSEDFVGFGLLNLPIVIVLAASSLRYRWVRPLAAPLVLVLVSYLPHSMEPHAGWMPQITYGRQDAVLRSSDRHWPSFARQSVERCVALAGDHGRRADIGVATNRILHTGPTIGIVALQAGLDADVHDVDLPQLSPGRIDGAYPRMNCVLTAEPGTGRQAYGYELNHHRVTSSLRAAGWTIVDRSVMPDGATQLTWWRDRGDRNLTD